MASSSSQATPPKPASATVSAGRVAALPFIMLTVLIDMLALGLAIPVLPSVVGSFVHSTAEQAWWYGVVSFVFGLANFLASPILGALSDAYGRRPILLLGFCGLGINFFATGLASTLWMLVAVRVIGGGMQANQAVANAYVADITPPELRAKRFGMLGAMFGLGFILGPVIGGTLGVINIRLPFFVAGTLAVLNLLYGFFVLPESLAPAQRRPFAWRSANPLSSLRSLTVLKDVGSLVGVIACTGLAQFILYTSWVLYTTYKFGWGPKENGWSLAAVGIMSVIVQGFLLGRLIPRFGAARVATFGLISSTLAYIGWGGASAGWMMFAIIFANIFGPSVAAAVQSLISSAADVDRQGQTLGAVSSLNSLMAVIAPLICGPLLGAVSHLPHGDWRIGAPMYLCAGLQSMALLLVLRHSKRNRA